jgi:hypothetical protein
MKKVFIVIAMIGLLSIKVIATTCNLEKGKTDTQPLLFTQNKGQVADMNGNVQPSVLFTTHSKGVKLFLTKNGISYQFQKTDYPEGYGRSDKKKRNEPELEKQVKTTTYRMDMELVGAAINPLIETESKNEYFENYYLPQCPNGILNVPTFSKIIYKEVYPKIDWIVYANGNEMKYDFIVHPGGKPADIKITYKNASAVNLMNDGGIIATTTIGQIIDNKPITIQNSEKITSDFKLENGIITYKLGQYDKQKDLIIDPGVVWSSYYGGSGDEYGKGLSVDASGNIYYAGTTSSTIGIASAGFQNSYNGVDKSAFLIKFNSNGSRQWATYYGSDYTEGSDVILDASGNVYLGGETQATTGIASGGFQSTISEGYDAFLVKFNSSGSRIWGTYFGGGNGSTLSSGIEVCSALAIDPSGNVYMTGYTQSTFGIASGGFQNTYIGDTTISTNSNAYLAKFSSSGSRIWSTYYGGNGLNIGYDVATDFNGNVYLCGVTPNTNGIASGGFQNTFGGGSVDGFLAKFNSTGSRIWATYYGGSAGEQVQSIVTDNSGNVYIAGGTGSQNGIASGGFQNISGGGNDGFIAKFNSVGSRIWSTYYGGSANDYIESITLDNTGYLYGIGSTSSTNNIALGGFQNFYGGAFDVLLVKFNNAGNRVGASYFGGSASETGTVIVSSTTGDIYIGGRTQSTSGISYNGFQNINGGGYDAFLTKLDDCAFFGYDTISPVLKACSGVNTTLSINGGTSYNWSNGGNTSSITVAPTQTTTYTVTVINSSNCTAIASKTVYVYPNTATNITADGLIKTIDTIVCGDVVQLQLNGVLNSSPNIAWTPSTNISNTGIINPLVYPSSTTNYIVSYVDTNGCTKSKAIMIYVKSTPTAGGVSITTPNSIISIVDTLYLNVQLSSVTDLYGLYMKLKGNTEVGTYLNYAGYTAGSLLGTGGSIISTPPTVASGIYDFGITKIGAVAGYTGTGLFYTFKFVTKNITIPNGTNFCFYLDNISANISSGASAGLINQGPYCYTFSDKVNVWPGDLNNSKSVTTADLLPIGYFYNSIGPIRQNASLQWIAQPATLWGYGQTYPNGSAYKVFADANGDGIISNADQTAIGFNISKVHLMIGKPSGANKSRSVADGDMLVTSNITAIDKTKLPEAITLKVTLKNNNGGLDSLYGIAFNLLLDSSVFDLNTATFDYTGSIFGNTGTDFLNIEYATDTTISIGLTRYANSAIKGNGDLCRINLKTKSTISNTILNAKIATSIEAANSQFGSPLIIQDSALTIPFRTNTGIQETSFDNLELYPNPTSQLLNIRSSSSIDEIKIYDIVGQLVMEIKRPQNNKLDISELKAGMYIAEVKMGNVTAKKSWVKE